MKYRIFTFLTICLMGLVLSAGCISQDDNAGIVAELDNTVNSAQVSAQAIIETVETFAETLNINAAPSNPEPEPAQNEKNGLFDLPLSSPPADLMVSVSTDKDPIKNTIAVRFDGGRGQDMVRSVIAGVTYSDGRTQTQDIEPRSGNTIIFEGTSGFDVVEVVVSYMNGQSYKILMEAVGFLRGNIDSVPLEREESAPAPSGDIGFAGPVVSPPKDLNVSVNVEKDTISKKITITFRGGSGQNIVQKIDTLVILSDGSVYEGTLDARVGADVIVDGSTNGTDRVQVIVSYLNGESYKIIDAELSSRGGMASN